MFSKEATKIDEIFTVNLTLTTKYQKEGEDFFNFCCVLRKYKLYVEGEKVEVGDFLHLCR